MSTCLTILLSIIFLLPFGPADDLLEKVREAYDFDNWPGKEGVLRQGVTLKKLDFSPYEIISVRSRLLSSGETILRYGIKGSSRPVFEVSVTVYDSVTGAQEGLLKFLSGCTASVPRGQTLGIDVGDINFAAKKGNVFTNVVFVRNNILIKVKTTGSGNKSEVEIIPDASETAKKIDEHIKGMEQAEEAKDLFRPEITVFSPVSGTVKPDTPVEIKLEVKDPKDGKLDICFDEAGGMVYTQDGKRYFKAEKPGEYTITIYAMNERFLVSKKSMTIRVEK